MNPERFPLGERLVILDQAQRRESRLSLLGRLARTAAQEVEAVVPLGEVRQLFEQYDIPWEIQPVQVRTDTQTKFYYIAKRHSETGVDEERSAQGTPRASSIVEWLGREQLQTVMAVEAFTGNALSKIFEFEIEARSNETPETTPLLLTPTELNIVRLLPFSFPAIAARLYLSNKGVISNYTRARDVNAMSDAEFVRAAYKERLIDMGSLEHVKPLKKLSSGERDLLQHYTFCSYDEAAARSGRSIYTIRTVWADIYKKLDIHFRRDKLARRAAFIVGLRENLIE